MIEDYYKALELRKDAGQTKIAKQYLKHVNRCYKLLQEDEKYRGEFYIVNRAIEILKDETIRVYYDIIHQELLNNTLDLSNAAIQKYMRIVNDGIAAGDEKADKLLADLEYRNHTGIIQTTKEFWLKYLVYANPTLLYKYIHLPILSLIYIIIGITICLRQIENFSSDYLTIGIVISLFNIAILFLNFASYIVGKIKK